jgi:phosphotransferase system, enzyme I, PtsP
MQRASGQSVSRRLLARVRDVMAGAGSAQGRLDQVVDTIAADMVAEVCSAYVRRAGDVLELYATTGLAPAAVHHTRLRVGEGLVGEIAAHARPLALSDAQSHPNFAYKPETGEEIYHSLMGVPILRDGRVLGVLAVQNKTRRQYEEEEIETLQTVAMVLAELMASGELVDHNEQLPADGNALLPLRIEGVRLNAGVGLGVALLHQPQVTIDRMVADDVEEEHARLRQAFSDMHGALDKMLQKTEIAVGGETQDIMETYRMIAEDAGWVTRIEEAITTGLTAEAAVQKVQNGIRARMGQTTDPYLRERIHDLEDLANRLLQHLVNGAGSKNAESDLPEDVVLIARNMGPAQLLDYDRARLRGLVLEEGSQMAHVAIVARAFDIPVVGQARSILDKVSQGDPIVVDGDNGQVFVRPGEEVRQAFADSQEARKLKEAAYESLRDLPAVTKDGVEISININAGLLVDAQYLEDSGADGIGLYRTEIPFMVRTEYPGLKEQQRFYESVLKIACAKPVVFRTLDVGGDKVLPYWDDFGGENPAMGWRAIRVSLDRPVLLRHQIRALIRASSGGDLRIMFPMVAEVSEFSAARDLVDMELAREKKRGGVLPKNLSAGVMLEVPSLVFQFPALLDIVDFVSVGSNDLFQFLFASDRGDARLSERYDLLSPSVLSLLRSVVRQCAAHNVPLSLCGEMAARPLEAMALIGLGFHSLSVAPQAVGPLKAMIRSVPLAVLTKYISSLEDPGEQHLRGKLTAFAQDHGVVI